MIIGSFVFRDDGDGCLASKYINRGMDTPLTESCKLRPNTTSGIPFTGIYTTAWIEDLTTVVQSELHITKRAHVDFYDLEWHINGAPAFWGQGMLYQGLLVGAYWDR